ncbi:hypothetical protein [Hoylesella nanceiensis]|uniref:hypothetical protein n=1 Tax=Hoylesella nanceiensis TaxID=425941 RepID=UPI00242C129E|nr:hypothetical protein [Hoylesella nanceiensis]
MTTPYDGGRKFISGRKKAVLQANKMILQNNPTALSRLTPLPFVYKACESAKEKQRYCRARALLFVCNSVAFVR